MVIGLLVVKIGFNLWVWGVISGRIIPGNAFVYMRQLGIYGRCVGFFSRRGVRFAVSAGAINRADGWSPPPIGSGDVS